MAEKKYTEHLGLTQQSEEDFVDGEEISRSFSVLDEKVWNNSNDLDGVKSEIYKKIGNIEDVSVGGSALVNLAYGDTGYVSFVETTENHWYIYSSVDGKNWTSKMGGPGKHLDYGGNIYVAATNANTINYIHSVNSAQISTDQDWLVQNIKGFNNGVIIMGEKLIKVQMGSGSFATAEAEVLSVVPKEPILDLVEGGDMHWACTETKVYGYSFLFNSSQKPVQILFVEQSGETYSSIVHDGITPYVTTRSGKIINIGSNRIIANGFEEGKNTLLYSDGLFCMQTPHNIYISRDAKEWKKVCTSDKQFNGAKVIGGKFVAYGEQGLKFFAPEQSLTEKVNQLNADLDSTAASLNSRFECGSVVVTGKSGAWSFVSVTYSHPHRSAPFVVASHGSTNVEQIACTTRNKTNTGFDIGVYNTTVQTTFNWIAIEP